VNDDPTPVDEAKAAYVPPTISFSDFQSWLITKMGQGIAEGHLLKLAMVSINQHFEAADRWARLESGYHASAPLWLNQHEAEKLANALKGNRGTEMRLLRQSIENLFGG